MFYATENWEGWHPSQEGRKMYDTDIRQIPNGRFTHCSPGFRTGVLSSFVGLCAQVCVLCALLIFTGNGGLTWEERKWLGGDLLAFLLFDSGTCNFWLQPWCYASTTLGYSQWETLLYLIQKPSLCFQGFHLCLTLKVCCSIFNGSLWNVGIHILNFVFLKRQKGLDMKI